MEDEGDEKRGQKEKGRGGGVSERESKTNRQKTGTNNKYLKHQVNVLVNRKEKSLIRRNYHCNKIERVKP